MSRAVRASVVADLLLPARGARARLLPLRAQRGGHRTERLGPGRQPLLVARGQFRLQVRMRLIRRRAAATPSAARRLPRPAPAPAGCWPASFSPTLFLPRQRLVPRCRHAARRRFEARGDAFQQAGRALLEGFGESIQRRAQVLRQRLARSLLLRQCLVPDVRHGGGARLETARQPVQLPLHGVRDGVVQRGRLARETRHRGLHDRLQRRAGGAGAFGDARPSTTARPTKRAACRWPRSCRGRRPGWRSAARSRRGSVARWSPSSPAADRPARASPRPAAAGA